MQQRRKKIGLSIILGIFSFITLTGSLFFVRPARALPVEILGDLPRLAAEVITQIKEGLGIAILNGALRAVSYFMRTLAYESAVWAASGGKGQSPLNNPDSFGKFLEKTASESFGEALSAVEDQFGLTLCQIPDIKLDLALRIGLRGLLTGPPAREGKCDFQQFTKAWSAESWKSKYGTAEGLAQQFNASIKTEDTDFGIYLDSVARIDQNVKRSREGALLSRLEGQGTKDFTDLISGNILTPAQQVKKYIESHTPDEQEKADQATIYAAIGSGFVQIIPSTISMFLNTLAGTMLKNFMTKGMLPFGVACVGENILENGLENCDKPSADSSFAGAGIGTGRAAAQAIFNELLTPTIGVETVYDLIAQLSNCPDNLTPSAFNCRADGGLVSALQEANSYGSKPVTMREAMDKDWLHKEWRLLPPNRPENKQKYSYRQFYTYANIKALRLARILPLGFEIAALNSDPDDPWTLEEVVGVGQDDGWYDCPGDKCHLIDPNWIIKAPASRCNASVFGNQPLSGDVPNRLEECVDLSSVVAYNSDRTPLSYAYCAREKNVWKSNADTCDDYYATCLAYTAPDGRQVGYLQRTLDTGDCSADTVGCSAYSLSQDESGNWLSPGLDITLASYNRGIHFNNKLSSSCGPNSAGCSAFKLASPSLSFQGEGEGEVAPLNLRKAPDYLKCYDRDLSVNGVQWASTTADLSRIEETKRPECTQYASACIADEVGCNMFTASVSGAEIPGKFTPGKNSAEGFKWNDQCAEVCEGYDGYVRLADNYSNGSPVDYVIPQAAASCRLEEVGCSGFTNMSEISAGGGERVEYFSLLRSCIKPDPSKQKNFITYEGLTAAGFQLKVYNLEKDGDGGPKHFYKDDAEKIKFNTVCNEEVYKTGGTHANWDLLLSPDCRQFNDDQGAVYYRLLSKTVVVSDKCTPYRLNSTEMEKLTATDTGACTAQKGQWFAGENDCRRCFQNGEYRGGFCYYNGLPGGVVASEGQSNSCSAAVESCHAYKGNAGNNIDKIAILDFNNPATALSGWSASAKVSAESTRVGTAERPEHSVSYTGQNALWWQVKSDDGTVGLKPGSSYVLSFWAKGQSTDKLKVSLNNGVNTELGEIQLSDFWRLYEFGAKELGGSVTSTKLIIDDTRVNTNITIYLDNLRLTKVREAIYLVKNKIKIDANCDADQNDNLPGEALGCKAYTVPDVSSKFYLKNFSYLCRENAIGCTALVDTQNTLDTDKPKAFNFWLYILGTYNYPSAESQRLQRVAWNEGKLLSFDTPSGETVSCQVPIGGQGCYVTVRDYSDFNRLVGQAKHYDDGTNLIISFNTSSLYIPADTVSTTPIYLVANQSATCNQVDLGCTYAGLQKQTPIGIQFTTVTIKNDPAGYTAIGGGTLCQSEAVGCNAYSVGAGSYYFKDPVATGQKICGYRERVPVAGVESSGWFWKDVGKCASGSRSGEYCLADSDCGASVLCANRDQLPCYPDYRQDGHNFGIWSYGDTATYDNFVGACATEQSGCTEFIDKNDKKADGLFQSYFWINNSKVSEGDCSGQVSLKDGCALFEQADRPFKQWNTAESYAASAANDSRRVPPVDGTAGAPADANRIIKVTRDRECGEWLQCLDSHTVYDSDSGWKEVCDTVGRCDKAPNIPEQGAISDCANLIDSYSRSDLNKILTARDYQSRDVTWGGQDYSGYSFLDMYQPDMLTQFNIGTNSDPDWRLVKQIPCGEVNCSSAGSESTACATSGGACGTGNVGICKNHTCIQTPFGTKNFDLLAEAPKPICRAYPDEKSPFPFTRLIDSSAAFERANKCSELTDPSDSDLKAFGCECYYTSAEYGEGAVARYFNDQIPNQGDGTVGAVPESDSGVVPPGICLGGDREGFKCSSDFECRPIDNSIPPNVISTGSCQKLKKQSTRLGWKGYCLEPDYSRNIWADENKFACLTWLPVGPIAGAADIYNQFSEAGYQPTNGLNGQYYCVNAQGYAHKTIVWGYGGSYSVGPETTAIDNKSQTRWQFPSSVVDLEDLYAPDPGAVNFPKFSMLLTTDAGVSDPSCSSGSWLQCNKWLDSANDPSDDGAAYRAYYTANELENQFIQSDIEYVEFLVKAASDTSPDPSANSSRVRIYPNIYKNDGPYLAATVGIEGRPSSPIGPGRYLAGNYLGKQNLPALFYSTRQFEPDPDGIVSDPPYYITEQGDMNFVFDRGEFTAGPLTIPAAHVNVTGNLFQPDDLQIGGTDIINSDLGLFDYWHNLSAICGDVSDDHHKGTWHSVVLKFHPDDKKFLGYYVFYCNPKVENGGVSYDVTFKLRDVCRTIADTTVDAAAASAVGWTNRLWSGSLRYSNAPPRYMFFPESSPPPSRPADPFATLLSDLDFNAALKPFGSLDNVGPLLGSPFNLGENTPANSKVVYLTDAEGILCNSGDCSLNPAGLALPGFHPALPYSCDEFDLNVLSTCRYTNDNNVVRHITSAYWPRDLYPIKISEVFAKPKSIYNFNVFQSVNKYYTGYTVGTSCNDTGENSALFSYLYRPLVHPVGECLETDQTKCEEVNSYGLTVNGVYDKDIKLFDSPAKAVMKFYASADADRMPMRSMIVDWDDRTPGYNSGGQSFLRNHRGSPAAGYNTCVAPDSSVPDVKICRLPIGNRAQGPGYQLYPGRSCERDSDCAFLDACILDSDTIANKPADFGHIADRTCDNTYYQFEHFYRCAPGRAGWDASCNGDSSFSRGCCIFQPKVQVKDNWGWCNGSCGDPNSPGGVFCYDDNDSDDPGCHNSARIRNATPNDECATHPGAWTKFSNKIFVAPSN